MNKTFVLALTGSLLLTGCSTVNSTMEKKMSAKEAPLSDAVKTATVDLKAAKSAGSEWRLLDKATGGAAVNLSKLLKVAVEKAEAGETAEADRIAALVSKGARLGIEQSKRYAGAKPYYN